MTPIRMLLDKLAPLSLKIQGLRIYRLAGRRLRPVITVRPASEAETCQALESIYQIESDFKIGAGVTPFVAYHGAHPIGFVELIQRGPLDVGSSGAWLYSLYVRNRYRGLGVGEDLCRAVISAAAAQGAQVLSLFVHAENASAQALYHKLGFQIVRDEQELARLCYVYDPGYPMIAMQKRLP